MSGTIFYPDAASYQAGLNLAGWYALCGKATEAASYVNPYYETFRREAASHGALFFAYHFLHAGLVAQQAAWCYSVVGPNVPLMVDCEPTPAGAGAHAGRIPRAASARLARVCDLPRALSRPLLADLTGFADAYRARGGTCHLAYLPRWYWAQIGGPNLGPLVGRKMPVVSSAYGTYTDDPSGAGWQPYYAGGPAPAVWQYADDVGVNGTTCDGNAVKGSGSPDVAVTFAELSRLVSTGSFAAAPQPFPQEEDDDMVIYPEAGGPALARAVPAGKTVVYLNADPGYRGFQVPTIRVAFSPWGEGEHDVDVAWPDGAAVPCAGKRKVTFARVDEPPEGQAPVPVEVTFG